ncbi:MULTISPECIES: hypothetical protein [Campylobacter]|uniref:Uncharacterized protein n=1 Tax=Campylobacter porcelli TaxID=1660073 RepID=A0A1X9SWV2_9BACT|nr:MULTISPECIES: hypothetical protein [unclassified Campylobacter]MCR8678362.1 hypothetical protein [Campylobacter sp. RM19072]MCR8695713.1 hypothetical protein [Campylobacter sp. RM19073]MEE3704285.1 hypothetical protein [Campylobacter sp. CX2-8023-23]MEE3743932.1 hypothetical protein [Campylobacter sp. CX2-4855-23]MEE3776190.1 hypothetical protein [Campylobacter sp. CX2-4080-23]
MSNLTAKERDELEHIFTQIQISRFKFNIYRYYKTLNKKSQFAIRLLRYKTKRLLK